MPLARASKVAVLVAAFLATPIIAGGPVRFYVSQGAPAGGDGSTWATAFDDLQDALDAAEAAVKPVEIWVAEGVYKPSVEFFAPPAQGGGIPLGPRDRTFRLFDGVRLYGGFAGTERSLEERDLTAHVTTLSGDLDGNDDPLDLPVGENAYHVVVIGDLSGSALLDGIVIRDGLANQGPGTNGPLDWRGSAGGFLRIGGPFATDFVNCTFIHNVSNLNVGAVRIEGSPGAPSLSRFVNCRFIRNHSLQYGGAAAVFDTQGQFVNCVFTQNQVNGGTGIALTVSQGSVATVRHCTFVGNSGGFGVIAAQRSTVVCSNSILYTDCSFFWNSGGTISADHCVVWPNCPGVEYVQGTNVDVLPGKWIFTLFADVAPDTAVGAGADGVLGTLDDDCSLAPGSPAIDAGSTTLAAPDFVDLDGDGDVAEAVPVDVTNRVRWFDDITVVDGGAGAPPLVDMGAYEFLGYSTANGLTPWIAADDGPWSDPTNWYLGPPGADDIAHFVLAETYTASTDAPISIDGIRVDDGNVTLDLGAPMTLSTREVPALSIGTMADRPASLSLVGGFKLTGRGADIGVAAGADGALSLSGAGTALLVLQENLAIGGAGVGSLRIEDGAYVSSFDAFIGTQADGFGSVQVSGAQSTWKSTFFVLVENGELVLSDGATIDPGILLLSRGAMLRGDGTVESVVTNFGDVDPGDGQPGTLVIEGNFQQSGSDPRQGDVSGRLRISVAGSGQGPGEPDVLAVEGIAALAGGLVVDFPDPTFDPSIGRSWSVLTAGDQIVGKFDVALLPGLGGDKLLHVVYPGDDGVAGGGAVMIEVAGLTAGQFGFEEPAEFLLPGGVAAAATVARLDADDRLDVAIVAPSVRDPEGEPGTLVVLLNADIDGEALVFAQQIVFENLIGRAPAAITAANVVGAEPGSLDELVIAEAGDDQVRVLGGLVITGGRSGMFELDDVVRVGDRPVDVTAADFTGDRAIDVATANALSHDVSVLVNVRGALAATAPIPLDDEDECSIEDLDFEETADSEPSGIVVGSRSGGRVHVFLSNGGVPPFDEPLPPIAVGAEPIDLATADLNGDGLDEIITSNVGDGTLSVIVATGRGAFAAAVTLPVQTAPVATGAIALADFDEDGDDDVAFLATTNAAERVVRVLRNDSAVGGTVVLADVEDVPGAGSALLVVSGDVDGDEDLDLITINEPAGQADARGPLGFTISAQLNTLKLAVLGDMNGDGAVDGADLGLLLACWGDLGGDCDLNQDGVVNGADLGILLAAWTA